ncbi:hypothetical protein MASR2M78_29200 [Treponema sp.]
MLGIVVLINTGARGAGYIWLMTGIFLAAIFGSRLLSILSIGTSVLALLLYAFFLSRGFPAYGGEPLSILIIASNILALCITLSVVLRSIQKSLSSSLQKQKGLALRLEGELSDMKIIRDKLRSSLAEKDALLQEVNHRVNNNMQMIMSLMALDEDGRGRSQSLSLRIRALSAANEIIHLDAHVVGANLADIIQAIISMERDHNLGDASDKTLIYYTNETEVPWFLKPQDAIIAALCIEEALDLLGAFAGPLRVILQEKNGTPYISISLPQGVFIQDSQAFQDALADGPIVRAAEGIFMFEAILSGDDCGNGITLKGDKIKFMQVKE